MINIAWIAAGGALGATLRYLTSIIVKYYFSTTIPLGTLAVNLIGSFFIGVLMFYSQNKIINDNFIRYFFIIGLLGSYTTFSAFSYELLELFNNRQFFISLIYILLSVGACLFFAFLGYNFNKIMF